MIRFLVCSFFLLFLNSCRKMPPITLCLYDKVRSKAHCVDDKNNPFECSFNAPLHPDMMECPDKLVMMPVEDYGIAMDYCLHRKKN